MTSPHHREVLEGRLAAWKDELETNKCGMAHLAERAIKLVEDQLERLDVYSTKEAAHE